MTTTENRPQFKVVGTRPIRHDGMDKVVGKAKYGADIILPGMLFGKVLRSPHAHANIKSIDTSGAMKIPGVKAVVTYQDLPLQDDKAIELGEQHANIKQMAQNCLASDKVLYKGHAVAAVAATSAHIAEEALDAIKVVYEVLPFVLNVDDAMKTGAPLLNDKLKMKALLGGKPDASKTEFIPNVASDARWVAGNADQALKESAVVVEHDFYTKPVHQGYIEPHVTTVSWAPDGKLTIWTSTQHSFGVRSQTSSIIKVPEGMIKVIPMEIGGGFGGKISVYLEPAAAILSRKTGKPVKIAMSRQEVFEASGPTSGSHMKIKMGATKEGKITGLKFWLAFEAGAYAGSPVAMGAQCATAPYVLDNFEVEALDVLLNKPKVAAYRAPGAPIGAYAIESCIDELAQKLGMDPMDFRLKNAAKEGTRMITGAPVTKVGGIETMEIVKNHPHYKSPLPAGPNVGRGVAIGYWFNIGAQSSATMSVNPDGTVSIVTGSVDIGGTRVAVAMQAAEILGLRSEDMFPSVGDTDSIGYTAVTGGSRTAFATGIAAINCAEEIKKQAIARAALMWEAKPEDVEFKDGHYINKKSPTDTFTLKQIAAKMMMTGGYLTASAISNPRGAGPAYGAMIVDVRVDPETGKVDLLRVTAFQDAGKAAHPSYVEGQIQGGGVQGIGWALNEEYFHTKEGVMANSSWLDYRMPTSLDLPMIDAVIVEVPNPGHPFGLRGVGEVGICAPLAAMRNAVSHAAKVNLYHLPMSPGSIVEAIGAQKAAGHTNGTAKH